MENLKLEFAIILAILINACCYLVARDFLGYSETHLIVVVCRSIKIFGWGYIVLVIYKFWIIYRQHFKE